MANEHWYVLRVRSGFETVVAKKLRKLNLEALVPDQKSINPQESHPPECQSPGYVYCRFAPENRMSVISIPGVVAVFDAPEPMSLDKGMASFQTMTFF